MVLGGQPPGSVGPRQANPALVCPSPSCYNPVNPSGCNRFRFRVDSCYEITACLLIEIDHYAQHIEAAR